MFNLSDESKETITIDSFEINEVGIILELQHYENGIIRNTELVSKSTGKVWKVIARLLYDHALQYQKIFAGEAKEFILIGFESTALLQESIDRIKDKESRNIFRYILEPVNHLEKPAIGDTLTIVKPTKRQFNLMKTR